MSVPVNLDRLAATLADFRGAYLITVGDDFRAHTVAVSAVLADGRFTVGPVGNGSRRNASRHGAVTLLWPPHQSGGYTLIVDGREGGLTEDDRLVVIPDRAVLHRRASTESPPTRPGCPDDCVPLA